ncbi:MAG: MoaD/ThiS family protein [Asgard group archaeon]|nr:MoaD/ThiS family protein [Asgard group archaeon]
MITVKLYGDLREEGDFSVKSPGSPITINIESAKIMNVNDILKELNISVEKISHIFVNGRYSSVKKEVKDEDRVAFFPKNMGLLYKWYFTKED